MTKEDALAEARRWLRSLSYQQLKELEVGLPPLARGGILQRPKVESGEALRPYSHPYYWAAFVLIGSPD